MTPFSKAIIGHSHLDQRTSTSRTPAIATISFATEKVSVSITADDDTASEPGSDKRSFTISEISDPGRFDGDLAISGTAQNGIDYCR